MIDTTDKRVCNMKMIAEFVVIVFLVFSHWLENNVYNFTAGIIIMQR